MPSAHLPDRKSATEPAFDPDCQLCDRELRAEPVNGWVYRDSFWSVGMLEGYEVPGWVVAQLRRHVVGVHRLHRSEQESLGPLLARLSQAAIEVTGAEKVYITTYGERFPHLHFLLMTRGADVPTSDRSAHLALNKDKYVDRVKSAAVAAGIRDWLATPADPAASY